jgi:hypothetical protein
MNAKINSLINEINKSIEVLDKINSFYKDYKSTKSCENENAIEQKEYSIVISEVVTNYYTCLETIFLRISQFFENQLNSEKWHKHLLERMRIHINGVREQAISDDTYYLLLELLKFRHFKRYYFEFNYDIDKIIFLEKKIEQVDPLVKKDMDTFLRFLQKLTEE